MFEDLPPSVFVCVPILRVKVLELKFETIRAVVCVHEGVEPVFSDCSNVLVQTPLI